MLILSNVQYFRGGYCLFGWIDTACMVYLQGMVTAYFKQYALLLGIDTAHTKQYAVLSGGGYCLYQNASLYIM